MHGEQNIKYYIVEIVVLRNYVLRYPIALCETGMFCLTKLSANWITQDQWQMNDISVRSSCGVPVSW